MANKALKPKLNKSLTDCNFLKDYPKHHRTIKSDQTLYLGYNSYSIFVLLSFK